MKQYRNCIEYKSGPARSLCRAPRGSLDHLRCKKRDLSHHSLCIDSARFHLRLGYQPTAPASGQSFKANTRSLLARPKRGKDSSSLRKCRWWRLGTQRMDAFPIQTGWLVYNTLPNSNLLLQMDNIRRCSYFLNRKMKNSDKNNYGLCESQLCC